MPTLVNMSVSSVANEIKASLTKELPCDELSDEATERCKDMFDRLGECEIDVKILTETLIGTVVSKFKPHATLGPIAKGLLKKWKKMAKESAAQAAAAAKPAKKPALERRDSSASVGSAVANADLEAEWGDLPPLRQNICKKIHSLLELSRRELVKGGVNKTAVGHLCVSRASEVEDAIQQKLGRDRQQYTDKARSICFNMKKNSQLRSNIMMGSIGAVELVGMTSEELATSDKREARDAEVRKLRDSRRLDWEQANESKINEMCGIKGDLLNASLFTCGRCKSTKTTSTQKQTRSADEPMTVFVLCINCGNRWKC